MDLGSSRVESFVPFAYHCYYHSQLRRLVQARLEISSSCQPVRCVNTSQREDDGRIWRRGEEVRGEESRGGERKVEEVRGEERSAKC